MANDNLNNQLFIKSKWIRFNETAFNSVEEDIGVMARAYEREERMRNERSTFSSLLELSGKELKMKIFDINLLPNSRQCPICGQVILITEVAADKFSFRCCSKHLAPRSKTLFDNSNLKFESIIKIIWYLSGKFDNAQIHANTKCAIGTIEKLRKKLSFFEIAAEMPQETIFDQFIRAIIAKNLEMVGKKNESE